MRSIEGGPGMIPCVKWKVRRAIVRRPTIAKTTIISFLARGSRIALDAARNYDSWG